METTQEEVFAIIGRLFVENLTLQRTLEQIKLSQNGKPVEPAEPVTVEEER